MTANEILGPGFAGLTEREQVRRVSTELEAIVLAQILGTLRRTVPDSGLFDQSLSQDIFRTMLDGEIARVAAERSPFGLADALTEGLENRFKDATESTEGAVKPPSISSSGGVRRSWRV